MFARLFVLQWIGGILAAAVLSPYTCDWRSGEVHPHIWAAIFLGGAIIAFPLYLIFTHPGQLFTRQCIAVAQMLVSALLIHLSGGRIETHFHIFGSLAFLTFYRDWRVLVSATIVVVVDHIVRGTFWPESIFGIAFASHWRWVEHAGWVVFEDIFLVMSCIQSQREMREIVRRQQDLKNTNAAIESEVHRRTRQLEDSQSACKSPRKRRRQRTGPRASSWRT